MPVNKLSIFTLYSFKDLVRTDLAMIQKRKRKIERHQNQSYPIF